MASSCCVNGPWKVLRKARFQAASIRLAGRYPWLASLLRVSLLSTFALGGVGILSATPARAFTGICPVLGTTQPPYPTPFDPLNPVPPPPASIAVPQEPVLVKVGGTTYPICAVYMSINQSNTKVADAIDPALLPPAVPNDILFPDLMAQPWFDKGTTIANDFANALIENGAWTIGSTDYTFSNAGNTTDDQNTSSGAGLLVNPKVQGNRNDSNPVPFFLWKNPVTGADGKARQVFVKQEGSKYTWSSNDADNLDKDTRYWFWVLDAPGDAVPGPLPLLGAGAAFGWTRRLRRRIRQHG